MSLLNLAKDKMKDDYRTIFNVIGSTDFINIGIAFIFICCKRDMKQFKSGSCVQMRKPIVSIPIRFLVDYIKIFKCVKKIIIGRGQNNVPKN